MPTLLMMAVFFGDLHVHTSISGDAVGDPTALFDVARNEENLDFVAITDHDTTMDAAEWDQTRDLAAAANVPGAFVAFSGIEFTSSVHLNVYFLEDDHPFCTDCSTNQQFYDFYAPTVLNGLAGAQINHPRNPFTILDDTVLRNVEILNGRHHGFVDHETVGNGVQDLLAQGHRLGFVGASDDHSYDGTGESLRRIGNTLTGCYAIDLTRGAILQALRNRRCFATDNLRTVLDLKVNDVAMGGETNVCSGESYAVDLFVDGTATPSLVELVQDNVVIASRDDCTSPNCDLSTTAIATGTFSNIYGRVHHDASTGCVNCKSFASPVRIGVFPGPCPPAGVPAVGRSGIAILVSVVAVAALIALRDRRPRGSA